MMAVVVHHPLHLSQVLCDIDVYWAAAVLASQAQPPESVPVDEALWQRSVNEALHPRQAL